MRIGILGGTFDPPHIAHLIFAQMVAEEEDLEKILFVLANLPPHKLSEPLSAVEHRLKMLELSLESNKLFDISDEEIKRGGISYSIDTIRSIKNRYSIGKEETIFIIGSDSLIELDTWKDPESILKESTVVVIKRYGYPVRKAREEYLRKVKMISLPQIDISSSEIRNRVRRGLSINYLVLPPVVDYIKRKGLYLR